MMMFRTSLVKEKKKFPYWYIFAALSLLYAFCDKVKHLELNTGERRNQI